MRLTCIIIKHHADLVHKLSNEVCGCYTQPSPLLIAQVSVVVLNLLNGLVTQKEQANTKTTSVVGWQKKS